MRKTIIIILSLFTISIMLAGCKKESLYTIDNSISIESSADTYDYSYSLNDKWEIVNTQNDNYVEYVNNENEVKLTIIKTQYDNAEKGTNIESKEIPSLFKGMSFAHITFDDMQEEASRTDYHGEFKFRYSRGILNDSRYQCIYFLSDNIIPSVSGEKVANCIIATYQDETDKNIDSFLRNLEQSIHYE